MIFFIHFFIYYARKEKTINFASVSNKNLTTINFSAKMKKNFKLLLLTLIMGGGLFASEAMALEQKDGVYQIGTAQDWAEFCSTHNNGTNQNLNAVLTADITVSGNTMVGINSIGKPYRGTFDGQGHKLTINYELNEERVAPFRRINGATIKNLIVEGTITTTSKLAAGIVGGIWQSGSTVINCVSNVTINDNNSGDATHGGICGSFEDVNGWNTIENCAFVGTINASNRKGCGGIVGWTNDQYIDDNKQNNNIIRNCYVLAENYKVYKGNDSDNDIICRNTAYVENCYYVGSIDGLKNDKGATAKNIEELLSTLGDGWYQNFSYTNYPVPFVDAQYTTQTDGYFQIENGSQLNWFSYYVNKTFNGANAKLTHDIDMTGVTGWTPIGQKEHEFKGHFDGQGHRINHLTTSAGYNNQALFGQAIGGAIIEKVIIGASCTIQGVDYTAGILGHVYGDGVIVRNCGNEANINGTGANSAGIVGCSEKKVYISNCYNTGAITGDRESAGICAWMGDAASTITNCYSIGEVKATGNNQSGSNKVLWRKDEVQGSNVYCKYDGQGTNITDKQITNGDLCFQLNNNNSEAIWYQAIGIDNHPYPFSRGNNSIVYKYGDNIYSNINGDNKYSEGYFQISNATDLQLFAGMVNGGNGSANAKLIKDIDLQSVSWTPIGQAQRDFAGHFDGQNHRIMNLDLSGNYEKFSRQALFGQAVGSAVIKNIIMDKSCTIKGISDVAGILGTVWGDGATIKNCINEATIEGSGDNVGGIVGTSNKIVHITGCLNKGSVTGNGSFVGGILGHITNVAGSGSTFINCGNEGKINAAGNNAAGIIGCVHSGISISILNCYNRASITGNNENAGLCGWVGSQQSQVKNCYNTGEINTKNNNTDIKCLWRFNNSIGCDNNYYSTSYNDDTQSATQIEDGWLTSGELCYKLNGSSSDNPSWYQTLGTDNYPVPFINGHKVIYNHTDFYSNIKKISGGFFEITNADDLESFAYTVNSGNTTAKGKLTDDIDMSGYNNFPGIGGSKTNDSDPNPICFEGVLDGDFHKITNLTITKEGLEAVGLVNSATAGASIMNLTIASTCSFSGRKAVGAFVGAIYNNSGTVTFLNCGNEGSVTSDGQNAGGILGCNFNGNIAIHMTNCYNIGTVKGNESGGISGWLSNNPVLRNCYNMGEVDGNDYFARMNNDGASLTNCFDSKSTWEALTSTHADGENKENIFNVATVFASLFDYTNTDPAVNGNVWRMEFSGTPHPVLYDAAIVYKEDFPNRPVAQENVEVKVVRPFVKENWNTVCLPFGMTAAQIATVFGEGTKVAALTGCVGTTLKFTTDAGIIEAGKPYLVYPTKDNLSDFTISGVNVEGSTITGIVQGGLTFMGTLQPTQVYATDYGITSGNFIKKAQPGTIKGFRAFFRETPSGARATNFVIDDETTTAIADDLIIDNARQNGSSKIYDLSGRQITSGQLNKGLYIVNGKKYIK